MCKLTKINNCIAAQNKWFFYQMQPLYTFLKMRVTYLLIIVFTLFVHSLSFGQTSEFQYSPHFVYFSNSTINKHKIKSISLTSYWTRRTGEMYKDQKWISNFNEAGDLICSKSYYFEKDAPEVITLQTIDCYEYKDGLLSRHLRYHNNKDSAEWIEEFAYELDQKGNIIKIEVKDLTNHHSRDIEKIYDSENRIITKKIILGSYTEYIYDSKGNVVEEISGPAKGPKTRETFLYFYNAAGNLIKYEFKGRSFDNFDTVKKTYKYDKQNRLLLEGLTTAGDETSVSMFTYNETDIKIIDFNYKGEVERIRTKNFEGGLIKTMVSEVDGKVHSKELFEYEFYK